MKQNLLQQTKQPLHPQAESAGQTSPQPKPRLFGKIMTLVLALVFVAGWGSEVMGQVVIGEDNTGNYTTWDSNTTTNNGFGFGNWSNELLGGGSRGHFRGNSQEQVGGNINSANGFAFAMFAHGAGDGAAGSALPLPRAMQAGDVFQFQVALNFLGGAKGFDLRQGTNTILNFNAGNGADDYRIDGSPIFSRNGSNNTVLTFTFEQTVDQLLWTVVRSGEFSGTQTGNKSMTPGTIDNIRFYIANSGAQPGDNLYFNNFSFQTSSINVIPAGATVRLDGSSNEILTANLSVASLEITSNASLSLATHDLTIQGGGTLTNNGTFTANDGKVIFANGGSATGGSASNPMVFNEVEVAGGSVSFNNHTSIGNGGSLTRNGGTVTAIPDNFYADGSALIYRGASSPRTAEWRDVPGVEGFDSNSPYNVIIETPLFIDSRNVKRGIRNDLIISNGGGLFFGSNGNESSMDREFTVGGNVNIGGQLNLEASNRPLIIGGSLEIQEGGSLTLGAFRGSTGGDLNIAGNWSNAGSFNANNRAVFFNGDNEQVLENTTGAPIGIDFLINDNTDGAITVNSNEITSIRLINNGVLNLNGNRFTLKPDPRTEGSVTSVIQNSASAVININPANNIDAAPLNGEGGELVIISGGFLINNGTINGDVTFERQITSPSFADPHPTGHWVALSSPVANTRIGSPLLTIDPLAPEFPEALLSSVWTQGFPGADDDRETIDINNINVFVVTNGDYARPGLTLPVGKGLLAFLFKNRVRDTETPVFNNDGFATFSVSGPVNNPNNGTSFDFPLEGEGSWNLLGNPFAESLSWEDMTKGELNGFAYILDPESQQYLATEDGHIAPFQAFWVKANDSQTGSLTAPASARGTVSSDNEDLFNTNPTPAFSLRLNADEMQSTTAFRFGEGFSTSFANTDAYYLSGLTTTFAFTYSLKDETPTMINSLPLDLTEAISFPIAAGAYVQGNAFTGEAAFTWPAFENIPAEWTITLTDTHTGTVVDLRDAVSYSFIMEAPAGLMSKVETFRDFQHEGTPVMHPMFTGERFILTIDPEMPTSAPIGSELPRVVSLSQNYPNPFNPTTLIRFELPASEEVRLEVYNVQGQRVAVLVNGTVQAGVHNVSFDASTLSSGVYLYRLQAGNQVLTRKMTLIK